MSDCLLKSVRIEAGIPMLKLGEKDEKLRVKTDQIYIEFGNSCASKKCVEPGCICKFMLDQGSALQFNKRDGGRH